MSRRIFGHIALFIFAVACVGTIALLVKLAVMFATLLA